MNDALIERLAGAVGLAIDWIDADGRPQRVSPETLRPILKGLGYPADDPEDLRASLERAEAARGEQLPPLLTLDHGQPLSLQHWATPGTTWHLQLEDGSRRDGKLDGESRLQEPLPTGYHRLVFGDHQLTLAVAPPHAWTVQDAARDAQARLWGIGVQLYSLRREGDGGLGDVLALEQFVRNAAEHGASAVAISPVHAMFAADSQRYSPYSPSSRLFHNVLHAAPSALLGELTVQQAIEACALGERWRALEGLELIDWPGVADARWQLWRRLFADFDQGETAQRADFESYRDSAGEALQRHCLFEALQSHQLQRGESGDWRRWSAALRDPHSAEVQRLATEMEREVRFHAFCQWMMDRGLQRAQQAACGAGMPIGLIADLAVGADCAGSQAWSRQSEVLAGLTVGAPPDILNRNGQSWGISAFSPTGLREHGFRAYLEMLRANLAHAGGIRIDHVMGLRRLWVIPEGLPSEHGAYLQYPQQDMLRLLALESHRHRAIVLGEDLGTVPEGFREDIAPRGLLGMRVMLFEQDHATHQFRTPQQWPATALATTTTHDLPTLSGWCDGRDIDWRARIEHYPEEKRQQQHEERRREAEGLTLAINRECGIDNAWPLERGLFLERALNFLGRTPAPLVLLPVEDALALDEQPNLPGTIDEHPNWRRRLPGEAARQLDESAASRRLQVLHESRLRTRSESP